MNIDNLKLRIKILIPLMLMALVVLGMGAFSAVKLANMSATAREIIEHRDLTATVMARAARTLLQAPYYVYASMVFDGDSAAAHAAEDGFPKVVQSATSLFDEAIRLSPQKAADIGKLKDRFLALAEQAKRPLKIGLDTPGLEAGSKLKAADLDKMAEGAGLMKDVDTQTRALLDDIVKFNDGLIAESARAADDMRAESSDAQFAMAVGGLASLVLAGAVSIWLSSAKIARPLVQLGGTMRLLSQGDLTVEIEGQDRRDEVGDMAKAVQVFKDAAIEKARLEAAAADQTANAHAARERAQIEAIEMERRIVGSAVSLALSKLVAKDLTYRMPTDTPEGYENYRSLQSVFNSAIAQIEEAMAGVTSSASAIHFGTREIATASDDLARRTEQQAASLEETAAALDQITATVRKSAEGAAHARHVVAAADEDAKNSAVVVRQAVEAMDAIAKSAEQIGQIIGVIDEIAFQTNLLALNAGVEAARAGDAGRGFAVVASEVRALAQRSAEAAKEIKNLISASTTQVDHGVKLVAATGGSLERIMAQVTEITGVVSEIALGAQEQATGLAQVNAAINQMDQVTQQNATMVQQSNAASRSLSQETEQLADLISQFQVGKGGSDSLRQELQRGAPHAFRQRVKAAPRAKPARATKAVVNGSVMVVDDAQAGDWQEF